MKLKLKIVVLLTVLAVQAVLAQENPASKPPAAPILVNIQSAGLDVRSVLHDLFTKVGKSYVVGDVPFRPLYLSVNDQEFEKALSLVCDLCKIHYDIKENVYVFNKGPRNSGPTAPPAADRSTATTTTSNEHPTGTTSTVTSIQLPPPHSKPTAQPTGKLSMAVLQKSVTGNYNKCDFRQLIASLAKQSGITIELDPSIPKYALDFRINNTSLGWALNSLCTTLKLNIIFTDHQTVLLKPKSTHP